jgi:AcrR family transcriptional regulator
MTIDNKEIWIKTGYEIFALTGQIGLKIEPLAKKVGISKSSFYHHFADIELFIDFLLKYHIEQSYIIAGKEKNAKNIDPELINVLVAHRTDLLFNRQLRIHENVQLFAKTLLQSNKIIGNSFKTVWVKDLNSSLTQKQIDGVFELALENFFLQINEDNLNYKWLSAYFASLKRITNNFI